jgi:hypothetical protein
MKTIIAASALTLFANLALAQDYQQGNFASPDLTPDYSHPSSNEFRPVNASNLRVSLQDYYAGNPDVFYRHERDDRPVIARSGGPTTLEILYAGNPDVIGGYERDGRSLISTREAVARQGKARDGGV